MKSTTEDTINRLMLESQLKESEWGKATGKYQNALKAKRAFCLHLMQTEPEEVWKPVLAQMSDAGKPEGGKE